MGTRDFKSNSHIKKSGSHVTLHMRKISWKCGSHLATRILKSDSHLKKSSSHIEISPKSSSQCYQLPVNFELWMTLTSDDLDLVWQESLPSEILTRKPSISDEYIPYCLHYSLKMKLSSYYIPVFDPYQSSRHLWSVSPWRGEQSITLTVNYFPREGSQ
jgi:hypothetical protein